MVTLELFVIVFCYYDTQKVVFGQNFYLQLHCRYIGLIFQTKVWTSKSEKSYFSVKVQILSASGQN